MLNRSFHAFAFDGAGIIGPYVYGPAVLETYKYIPYDDIKSVIGTSSGAMSAIGACMYQSSDIIHHLPIFDTSQLLKPRSLVWTLFNLAYRFGTHDNAGIRASIEAIAEFKTGNKNITFGEIKREFNKDLYIITATVCKIGSTYTSIPFVFSPYNASDTSVVTVALASTAIGGYFAYSRLKEVRPGCFKEVNEGGHVYFDAVFIPTVDPINLLVDELQKRNTTSSAETLRAGVLGFFIKSQVRNKPFPTELPSFRPHTMLWAILNRLLYDLRHLNCENENTIYIDPKGISPIHFGITAEQKAQLFISATQAAFHFFQPNKDIPTDISVPSFNPKKPSVDYINLLISVLSCAAFIRSSYKNGIRSGLWDAAKTYVISDTVKDVVTYSCRK